MRVFLVLVLLFASLIGLTPAKAQSYDQATIEAHLQEMFRQHGDRLHRWKGPIFYIATGFESEATNRLIDRHFAYLRDLTGLDIRNAAESGHKGNFVLVFADPLTSIVNSETIRAVFGEEGQSDADYLAMLKELDRNSSSRSVRKSTRGEVFFYAALINPGPWEDDEISSRLLKLIVIGLTQAGNSDGIRPSVFNAEGGATPKSRLPSIDEAFLRNLYRGLVRPGTPIDQAIPHLAAAMTFDLNN